MPFRKLEWHFLLFEFGSFQYREIHKYLICILRISSTDSFVDVAYSHIKGVDLLPSLKIDMRFINPEKNRNDSGTCSKFVLENDNIKIFSSWSSCSVS